MNLLNERVVLDADKMGENLVVSENGSVVTQTGQTQNFEGAWILGSVPLCRGRWVCEFHVERRKRWMAVGFALESIKLNRPINRTNIFVYASTGSIKANDHTAARSSDDRGENDDDEGGQQETNSAWASFGSQYKTHDVVRAHLDMDLGVLGFSTTTTTSRQRNASDNDDGQHPRDEDDDDEEVKEAYARLRGQKLFPAVYICGQGDSVRFKCSRVMDPIENPSFLPFLDTALGDELGADMVTFVVQGQRIRAHKFLLTARSQYFKTMINNHHRQSRLQQDDDVLEENALGPSSPMRATRRKAASGGTLVAQQTALTTTNTSTEIAITGADYTTFAAVLKFIYSGGDPDEIPGTL